MYYLHFKKFINLKKCSLKSSYWEKKNHKIHTLPRKVVFSIIIGSSISRYGGHISRIIRTTVSNTFMTNCLLLSVQEHWKYSAERYTWLKGLSGRRACVTWLHTGHGYVKCCEMSPQPNLSSASRFFQRVIRSNRVTLCHSSCTHLPQRVKFWVTVLLDGRQALNPTVTVQYILGYFWSTDLQFVQAQRIFWLLIGFFFSTRGTANALHIKIYGLRNLWAVTAESLCRNVPLISKWCLLCFIKMLCSLHKQCEESV